MVKRTPEQCREQAAKARETGKFGLENMTSERRTEIGRLGAAKSYEVRKQKKSMKETLLMLLSCPVTDAKVKDELKKLGIEDEEMTQQTAMLIAQMRQAHYNPKSAEFVRDTTGQKEADKLDIISPIAVIVEDDYGDDKV